MKKENVICITIMMQSFCWVNLDKLFKCIWIVKYNLNEGYFTWDNNANLKSNNKNMLLPLIRKSIVPE